MSITISERPVRNGGPVRERDERAAEDTGPDYLPPTVEVLGSLKTLTRGGGPGGRPIVMITGSGI